MKLKLDNINAMTIVKSLQTGLHESMWPRLVGGCVRDMILNIQPNDIDIITPLSPKIVSKMLHYAKVIPTGIDFGTITVIMHKEKFEITTLREDIKCYGRYAKVLFTKDFKLDAARRDFTINAISYCPSRNILYDYFNGMNDLRQRKIVFIGNPVKRIQEDYLRIMRFFRFSSRYSSALNEECYKHCIKNIQKLNEVSRERILQELNKIISYDNINIIRRLAQDGVLNSIFISLNINIELFIKLQKICNKLSNELRYAVLFIENNLIDVEEELKKNKFSKFAKNKIINLIKITQEKKDNFLMYAKWYNHDSYKDYIIIYCIKHNLNSTSVRHYLDFFATIRRKALPIKAKFLIQHGYQNHEIKKAIDLLKKIWIQGKFMNTEKEMEVVVASQFVES